MKPNPKTKVVFRKWRKGSFRGQVIALFPREPGTNDLATCNSYEHIGQHSSADVWHVIRATLPAKPRELADLARELRRYGPPDCHYNLQIGSRCTRADYEARKAELAAMNARAKAKL